MGNFILMLLQPPSDNTCLVVWIIVILKDITPSWEEMLHYGMHMMAHDDNVACCINPNFSWNEWIQAMWRRCAPNHDGNTRNFYYWMRH